MEVYFSLMIRSRRFVPGWWDGQGAQADDGSAIVNTGPPRSSHTQEGDEQGGPGMGGFRGQAWKWHSSHPTSSNAIIWPNLTSRRLGNVASCELRKGESECLWTQWSPPNQAVSDP